MITENTNNEETKLKKKLRKMGFHNKATSCIKKRTSDVRSIPEGEHKPENFTLLEDYLSRMVYKEDFASLPIEDKQRIWKEQILAEFYQKYPQHRPKEKEYPYSIEEETRDKRTNRTYEDIPQASGSQPTQRKQGKTQYKISKDKQGNPIMVLEDGTIIPLS